MSFFLNCAYVAIDIIAKVSSLLLAVSRMCTDILVKAYTTNTTLYYRRPTDPEKALRGSLDFTSEPSSWPQVEAYATKISMVSSSNMAHEHQHGFRLQLRPWIHTWPLVVTRAMITNRDLDCSRLLALDMAFGGKMDLDTTMASGNNFRLLTSAWPLPSSLACTSSFTSLFLYIYIVSPLCIWSSWCCPLSVVTLQNYPWFYCLSLSFLSFLLVYIHMLHLCFLSYNKATNKGLKTVTGRQNGLRMNSWFSLCVLKILIRIKYLQTMRRFSSSLFYAFYGQYISAFTTSTMVFRLFQFALPVTF